MRYISETETKRISKLRTLDQQLNYYDEVVSSSFLTDSDKTDLVNIIFKTHPFFEAFLWSYKLNETLINLPSNSLQIINSLIEKLTRLPDELKQDCKIKILDRGEHLVDFLSSHPHLIDPLLECIDLFTPINGGKSLFIELVCFTDHAEILDCLFKHFDNLSEDIKTRELIERVSYQSDEFESIPHPKYGDYENVYIRTINKTYTMFEWIISKKSEAAIGLVRIIEQLPEEYEDKVWSEYKLSDNDFCSKELCQAYYLFQLKREISNLRGKEDKPAYQQKYMRELEKLRVALVHDRDKNQCKLWDGFKNNIERERAIVREIVAKEQIRDGYLLKLKEKIDEFEKKQDKPAYKKAYKEANTLYGALVKDRDGNQCKNWISLIDRAKKDTSLTQHRGMKDIFIGLLLFPYALYKLCKGTFFTKPFTRTDTAVIMDELSNATFHAA